MFISDPDFQARVAQQNHDFSIVMACMLIVIIGVICVMFAFDFFVITNKPVKMGLGKKILATVGFTLIGSIVLKIILFVFLG